MKKLATIIIGGAVIAGAAVYYGVNSAATSKIKIEIDKVLAEAKGNKEIVDVTYSDIAVNAFSQSAVLSDVIIVSSEGKIVVDSLTVSDYDYSREIPYSSDVKMKNIRIPLSTLDMSESEQKDLADFGIEKELVLNVESKHQYDEDTKKLTAHSSVTVANIGDYSVDLDLGSLDLVALQKIMDDSKDGEVNPMVAMGIVGGLELNSISIDFNDAGVIESAANKLRKEESEFKAAKSASEVRTLVASLLREQLTQMKKQDDQIAKKILTFVESGKGFTVKVNPTSKGLMALGMSLQQYAQTLDIDGIRKVLNLEIEVK